MEPILHEEEFLAKDINSENHLLIGLLDASETLLKVWRQMAFFYNVISQRWTKKTTIIFNSKIYRAKEFVSGFIHDFGLDAKNIRKGFAALDDIITCKKRIKSFTVIIISDVDESNSEFNANLKETLRNPAMKGKTGSFIIFRISNINPYLQNVTLKKISNGIEQNIQSFNIVGLSVDRNNDNRRNPWLIKVLGIHEENTNPDTVMLPLYETRDFTIMSFMKTELFSQIMDFSVLGKIYRIKDITYAAILSNALIFLVGSPKSLIRDTLINKILMTYFNFVLPTEAISYYKNLLLLNPRRAMVLSTNVALNNPCESLAKPLTMLLVLIKFKLLTNKVKIEEILEAIICEQVGRVFFNKKYDTIENYLFLTEKAKIIAYYEAAAFSEVLSISKINLIEYQNESELKKTLKIKLYELPIHLPFDVKLDINESLFFKKKEGVGFKLLEALYNQFLGKPFLKRLYAPFLINALERDSFSRNDGELDEEDVVSTYLNTVLLKKLFYKVHAESLEKKWPEIANAYRVFKEQNKDFFKEKLDAKIRNEEECMSEILSEIKYLL